MLGPSKWLALYEDFVTKNSSSVGQVESALRSLTYIIPGECDRTEYYRERVGTLTFIHQDAIANPKLPQNVVSLHFTLYTSSL